MFDMVELRYEPHSCHFFALLRSLPRHVSSTHCWLLISEASLSPFAKKHYGGSLCSGEVQHYLRSLVLFRLQRKLHRYQHVLRSIGARFLSPLRFSIFRTHVFFFYKCQPRNRCSCLFGEPAVFESAVDIIVVADYPQLCVLFIHVLCLAVERRLHFRTVCY